jgi:single-stranded-DNA-specific exonuclease
MTTKTWVVAPRTADDIITQLLKNRGIKSRKDIDNFLNPPHPQKIVDDDQAYLQKIDPNELDKAVLLIKKAITKNRPVVIHGDYDVDGICGTAILYKALKKLGANVSPFIPDRFDEGYGLSIESIDKIQSSKFKVQNYEGKPLLITTDCGITAVEAAEHAKSLNFEVIITDHHSPGQTRPKAEAIVWTDELAGAGIAWILARHLASYKTPAIASDLYYEDLDLVALATIADIQPVLGVNRSLVKYGLVELNATRQAGLKELIKISGLENKEIGTYEVGWMLAPRLNAAGRLENAAAALRLLITDDESEAKKLAEKLHYINAERQQLTNQVIKIAQKKHRESENFRETKVILLTHQEWHEGIIGLVAGRIKEEFYRPTVIISQGEEISKGSARSIAGFNIVEAIRECGEHLVDAGGHKMAAGFTIETKKINAFHKKLIEVAEQRLDQKLLSPIISIDACLKPTSINWDLLKKLKQFEPFGIGNPRPIFLTEGLQVSTVKTVGSDDKHLKLWLKSSNNLSGIGFNLGHRADKIFAGDVIDIVYSLEENAWNGNRSLQLRIKDLKPRQKQGVDKLIGAC